MASSPQNDFLILLVIILALFGLWTIRGGPSRASEGESRSLFSVKTFTARERDTKLSGSTAKGKEGSANPLVTLTGSPWKDKVTITAGNARTNNQPAEEYIVIKASSRLKEPVTITGWLLQNGAGSRLYDQNGKVVTGQMRIVQIPSGIYRFTDSRNDPVTPIVLRPGEQAVVTTGQPRPIKADLKNIDGSFRTNKCTGYIEQLPRYNFIPALPKTCPNPDDELGLTALSDDCQSFVTKRIATCHTPVFSDYKTIKGEREQGKFVDGFDGLSGTCRNYIERHFSFKGCLQFHGNDPDFYAKSQWRIYLGQTWELWESRKETISLYDSQGRLVDQIKYQFSPDWVRGHLMVSQFCYYDKK